MLRMTFAVIFLAFTSVAYNQFSIEGTVKSQDGEALPGANIVLKETGRGTTTNENGEFIFDGVRKGNYTLSVTYLGFEDYENAFRLNSNINLDVVLNTSSILGEEIIVRSIRATNETPVSYENVSREKLNERNLGQDLPYLLSHSVSVVTTSDAGAGVGYTGLRIRGTDANRINFTVNGIPVNDAESHGVWWVNMPDFVSSLENVQIQRGVGTSTNGAGAFGATINMQTEQLNKVAYGEISSSAGSFKTFRNTVKAGTGLLGDHFAFDARLSKITSDGFIDRATSELKSFFVSGGWYAEKSFLKVNIFSGDQTTYQSWNGVPKVRLEDDTEGMQRYEDHGLYTHEETKLMMNSGSRTYNIYTYENETDNYQQDHYQLFLAHSFSPSFNINIAFHYTRGRGYYEQYRKEDDLADYGIPDILIGNDTVTSTDLVRRKWLDNDFYGTTYSVNYLTKNLKIDFGGGWNLYDGRHFGNVIWGQLLGDIPKDYEWYRNKGIKTDFNIYGKINYAVISEVNLFADLQYRNIVHDIAGIDDNDRDITQNHTFNFFNPKAGIKVLPGLNHEAYAFYGIGHREPNRSNFTDAPAEGKVPVAEELHDIEAGYTYKSQRIKSGINLYYMIYNDQLILTGEINDVGSAIMVNVDKSFRRGIELFAEWKPLKKLEWRGNISLSENKILDFTEYVDDWDHGGQVSIAFAKTDISFSPPVILFSDIIINITDRATVSFTSNYVGRQFIDNTSNKDRSLDPYFVNNMRFAYTLKTSFLKRTDFQLMINNIFNEEYESNAWVYSYLLENERYTMDGYFPQAGINFLAGINILF